MCIIQRLGRYIPPSTFFLPCFLLPDVIRSVNRNHSGAHSFFVSFLPSPPHTHDAFLLFRYLWSWDRRWVPSTLLEYSERGVVPSFRPDFPLSFSALSLQPHTAESIRESRGDKIVLTWNFVTQPREENGGRGCVPLLSNLLLLRSTFVISIFTQLKNNSHSMELEIALQINRIVTRWLILRKMVGGYWITVFCFWRSDNSFAIRLFRGLISLCNIGIVIIMISIWYFVR